MTAKKPLPRDRDELEKLIWKFSNEHADAGDAAEAILAAYSIPPALRAMMLRRWFSDYVEVLREEQSEIDEDDIDPETAAAFTRLLRSDPQGHA